eukprot:Sspe_Gene.96375::Locus_69044_Transcript_1_3_Confidence_0.400_Length_867::g.96375::m.96375
MDPPLTREEAEAAVDEYGEAWVTQDEHRIARLFTPNAEYVERVGDPDGVYRGEGIRDYWTWQIAGKQRDIVFENLRDDMVVDQEKGMVMAKWRARFTNVQPGGDVKEVEFTQVAMLRLVRDGDRVRIAYLEEYWHSPKLDRREYGMRYLSGKPVKSSKGYKKSLSRFRDTGLWDRVPSLAEYTMR